MSLVQTSTTSWHDQIPIISTGGESVHCDLLKQEISSTLLEVRAMLKVGFTISLPSVKEETKHSESVFLSSYNYQIEHHSAKTVPHAFFVYHYATIKPTSKTPHTQLMQLLPVSREDPQWGSRIFLGFL